MAKRTKNQSVKDAVLEVFDKIGGINGFAIWAEKNRTDFYQLYGKLLPKNIDVDVKVKLEDIVAGVEDSDNDTQLEQTTVGELNAKEVIDVGSKRINEEIAVPGSGTARNESSDNGREPI